MKIFAFSQALLLVFAWRKLISFLSLQKFYVFQKRLNYEKSNDDTDGCRIRHRS